MIISFKKFIDIVTAKIKHDKDLYMSLLDKLIKYPARYTGYFRLSNPKTKLIQNATQSREINFGDVMEMVITKYIAELGYVNKEKVIEVGDEKLYTDQFFCDINENVYIIEQKIRDDHDSTKKRGQFENFLKKIKAYREKYPENKIYASMWFIDAEFGNKNSNYYKEKMEEHKDDFENVEMRLFYGKEIFEDLFKRADAWHEIIDYLTKNKEIINSTPWNIPDFDTSPEVFECMKKLSEEKLKKLFSDNEKYTMLRKEVFPTGTNFKKLKEYFKEKDDDRWKLIVF